MKRKVSDEALKKVVLARITKGEAFSLSSAEYRNRQEKVKAELDTMTRAEIMAKWSYACYDIK